MAEFGAAVHDAQVLERSLEYILVLLDHTALPGEQLPNASELYGPESTASLGKLVNVLRKRIELPREDSDELEKAIKTRNSLVHGYFKPESRLVATLTASGADGLVSEIREIRASMKMWNKITDGILDTLLRRDGTSIKKLCELAETMYATAQLQEFRGLKH
ncbi:MAG: hypothetical protein ACRETN_03760 [Nevskiales bacterium]